MQSTTLQTVAANGSDLDILTHLNLEYVRSVEESDVPWFDAHLAPDFMNSNPDGSLVDRQAFLDQIARGAGVFDIKAHDVIIRIMGDLAIIHAATTYKTITGPLKGRYTDIWSRREQATLDCEFLMQITADLDDPQILSGTPLGTRRILCGKRGVFSGPGLQGELLPGGGDWVLLRHDGVAELDIRFALQTDDKQLIYMHCLGIFHAPPPVSQRIRAGEDVDPSKYYFRTCPRFETGSAKYSRLNRMIAVGVGKRTSEGMVTDIFAIK